MENAPWSRTQTVQTITDVGDIAHDLNNLLTAILGHSALATVAEGEVGSVRPHVTRIEAAARRAADLTARLLAVSGRGMTVVQPIALNCMAGGVLDAIQLALPESITITRELSPGLPQIQGDHAQIEQVIANLIANSIEAITPRSGTICVRTGVVNADRRYLEQTGFVEQLAEGAYVFLQCEDDGCGMDDVTLRRIFEPFFTTKKSGRGMGLAKLLGFVRSHRGGIKVVSELGAGTRFTVLLPVASRFDDQTPSEPLRALGTLSPPPRGHSILVVDDEESVREVVAETLKRFGFDAIVAAGGTEALELLQTRGDEIAAAVIDLTMPGLDGDTLLKHIAGVRPDLRVVMMSGFGVHEVAARVRGFPCAAFLQKPFQPVRLIEQIRSVLGLPISAAEPTAAEPPLTNEAAS